MFVKFSLLVLKFSVIFALPQCSITPLKSIVRSKALQFVF